MVCPAFSCELLSFFSFSTLIENPLLFDIRLLYTRYGKSLLTLLPMAFSG
jgi:hypothetical protein